MPHHGVRHTSKPIKVKIANFGGAYLNNKPLSGLEITKMLAGVFLRFRPEEVASMGDIEAMFYQVKVPDNQGGFLRYLWWVNNNLEGPLVNY